MGKTLLIAVALIALAGCRSAANQEVEVSDGPILYPTGRVVIGNFVRPPENGDGPDFVGEFELGVTGAAGDDRQDLDAGDFMRAGRLSRRGPVTLSIDYSLIEATALMRAGWRFPEGDILFLVGLGYCYSELEVTDGRNKGRFSEHRAGPVMGLEGAWEPLPNLDLYGRASLMFSWDSEGRQLEIGTGYRFVEWARVFLAYRWWRYKFEPENFIEGDETNHFDVTTDGVVLGLELLF